MSPRTKTQLEELRAGRKEKIMETALELFAFSGFHATSISQIASKAGIAKGSVYHYFESKDVLLAEIFTSLYDELMSDFTQNPGKPMQQKDAWRFIDLVFDHMTAHQNRWKLFMQLSVQPGILEILMDVSREQKYTDYLDSIYQYFANADTDDPQFSMIMFSSVMKGFSFMYVMAPEMFTLEQVAQIKEYIKKHFLKFKKMKNNEKDTSIDDTGRYMLL